MFIKLKIDTYNLEVYNIDLKGIFDGRNQFLIMGIKIIAL